MCCRHLSLRKAHTAIAPFAANAPGNRWARVLTRSNGRIIDSLAFRRLPAAAANFPKVPPSHTDSRGRRWPDRKQCPNVDSGCPTVQAPRARGKRRQTRFWPPPDRVRCSLTSGLRQLFRPIAPVDFLPHGAGSAIPAGADSRANLRRRFLQSIPLRR